MSCVGHAGICDLALSCVWDRTLSYFLRTCSYSLTGHPKLDEATQRAFAEAIFANEDSALIGLQGIDLSLYVDVLGVSDGFEGNRAILAQVQAQRITQQRVKSARGGTR
jgi:hypothetical protein